MLVETHARKILSVAPATLSIQGLLAIVIAMHLASTTTLPPGSLVAAALCEFFLTLTTWKVLEPGHTQRAGAVVAAVMWITLAALVSLTPSMVREECLTRLDASGIGAGPGIVHTLSLIHI